MEGDDCIKLFLLLLFLLMTLSGCNANSTETKAPLASAVPTKTEVPPPTPTPGTPTTKPFNYSEYNISLEVNPYTKKVVGVEKIKYVNNTKVSLEKICFNMYLNAFSENNTIEPKPYFPEQEAEIFPNGKEYGSIKVLSVTCKKEDLPFTQQGSVLEVALTEVLAPAASIEVSLQLEAELPLINGRTGGLTRKVEQEADDQNKESHYTTETYLWLGNFIPTVAVFGETDFNLYPYYPVGSPFYSNVANFTVEITTPPEFTVIGTGSKKETPAGQNTNNSKKTSTFTAPLVRDFAFAVSNAYKRKTINANGIEINLYYFSELSNMEGMLSTAAYSLEYYSRRIGSYPYTHLDIVETGLPDKIAADYPQVIFMDTEKLKNDPGFTTLSREIADQWFYNIIGSNRIKEAWLSEGLAGFVKESIFRDPEDLEEKMQQDYENYKNSGTKMYPLSDDLSVYKSWNEYYKTQHIRSKLMFYSLYRRLGQEKFDTLLKTYYAQYSFRNATKKDLIKLLKDIDGSDYTEFFIQWGEGVELPVLH